MRVLTGMAGPFDVWAYSSVVEHYVDIVGVPSSILGTPTIEILLKR